MWSWVRTKYNLQSPKALNLRLWCFPALYCSTYIFVIKTNTESTQPLATQTQDAVVSPFISEVFEDLCWTSSSLTFSEKLMEVLLYTIIFAPDPLMTSEIMKKNGVTWCYFNQIFLYHWGRESVCFLFFICLPEGRGGPLKSPKMVKKALKYKEAESSNISHSSRRPGKQEWKLD